MGNAGAFDPIFEIGLTDRLIGIIRSIEASDQWDQCKNETDLYLYQVKAAINVGVFEPLTAEQQSLNCYLRHRKAGRRLCDYAWRLLAQSPA